MICSRHHLSDGLADDSLVAQMAQWLQDRLPALADAVFVGETAAIGRLRQRCATTHTAIVFPSRPGQGPALFKPGQLT